MSKLSNLMLHGNSVPLYPFYAGSFHIKEYKKNAPPYVRAHAQYGVFPLTPLSSFTTGITFSGLAHMEGEEIERNRKIYFFWKPKEMEFYPFRTPHSKWCFLPLSTISGLWHQKKMWQKRPNDKHMMWDRKCSKDWHQEKYILWLYQVFTIVSVLYLRTELTWLPGLDLCPNSSQIGAWVKSHVLVARDKENEEVWFSTSLLFSQQYYLWAESINEFLDLHGQWEAHADRQFPWAHSSGQMP